MAHAAIFGAALHAVHSARSALHRRASVLRPTQATHGSDTAAVQVTCLDATKKKATFIESAAELCGAHNVRAVHARCEDLAHDTAHREAYDVVTSRAVAGTRTLVELCLPFAKVGGRMVAAKGPHIHVRTQTYL